MKRKLKRVNQKARPLRLTAGLKRAVRKKKTLFDELAVGDWVQINETGENAIIMEILPEGMLRLLSDGNVFQTPREKVHDFTDFEEKLYQEKEQEYLTRSRKEKLEAVQREDLKKYCAEYSQWKAAYPNADEMSWPWRIAIILCFLPLVLSIASICLRAVEIVAAPVGIGIPYAILSAVIGAFILPVIQAYVTPGVMQLPQFPLSLEIHRGGGSSGGGGCGGGGGGCGGGGGGCGGGG